MFEERRTGKLKWRLDSDVWNLMEGVETPVGFGLMRDWRYTGWWIWRLIPIWPCPYEVTFVSEDEPKLVKLFLSLRKAKAFAEVMHRMGVRYD